MSLDLKQKLNELHESLVTGLIARLQDQDNCTAADRALAWQILKDNGVALDVLAGSVKERPPLTLRVPFPDEAEAV